MLESDASDKDTADSPCSDYDEKVVESGDEGDVTPVVTEIENGREEQVLEYAGK